jgi:hypothetical protein
VLFPLVHPLFELNLALDLLQFLFLVADAFFEFLLIGAHVIVAELKLFYFLLD